MSPLYVKVRLRNAKGEILEHFYIASSQWNLPAGKIEEGEAPRAAAARELLERAGFEAEEKYFTDAGVEEDQGEQFAVFEVSKAHTKKVAEPGERGGYRTKIRWRAHS